MAALEKSQWQNPHYPSFLRGILLRLPIRPQLRINPRLKRYTHTPGLKQQEAPSCKQRFNFIFLGVPSYQVLLLYFLPDIWVFPEILTTCLALSLRISVHMAPICVIWDSDCLTCAMSISPSHDPWLWSKLEQRPPWSFKPFSRSLGSLIWHSELLHTYQHNRGQDLASGPLVFYQKV